MTPRACLLTARVLMGIQGAFLVACCIAWDVARKPLLLAAFVVAVGEIVFRWWVGRSLDKRGRRR